MCGVPRLPPPDGIGNSLQNKQKRKEAMNNIQGIYSRGYGGPEPVRSQKTPSQNTPQPSPAPGARPDQVDISPVAQLLSRVAQLPDIRQEKVEHIRAQIAAGIYETPEKLNAAVDKLLEEHSF